METRTSVKSTALSVLTLAMLAPAVFVRAQIMRGPVLPLNTTMVIEKPSSDTNLRQQKTISIGVKDKSYVFILRDAYVDDVSGKFMWGDIWRSTEQFRPNFLAQGIGSAAFEKLKPGEVVTVTGLYFMTTRTFEVSSVSPGAGKFAPKAKY